MTVKVIEGFGVGVSGYEDDFLVVDDETYGASGLLPERVEQRKHDAIVCRGVAAIHDTDYWTRQYNEHVAGKPLPTVYRVKITVESEPLTQAESDAWWKAREERDEPEDDE